MTQWYPKLAEYDFEGWHADPYIGREFHGVWGDFDVTINIDKSYVVGGTGYLQNPNEIGHGYENSTLNLPEGNKLSWHFVLLKFMTLHGQQTLNTFMMFILWKMDLHYIFFIKIIQI